jgi:hypothetical protein
MEHQRFFGDGNGGATSLEVMTTRQGPSIIEQWQEQELTPNDTFFGDEAMNNYDICDFAKSNCAYAQDVEIFKKFCYENYENCPRRKEKLEARK